MIPAVPYNSEDLNPATVPVLDRRRSIENGKNGKMEGLGMG